MKRWEIRNKLAVGSWQLAVEEVVSILLANRGFKTKAEQKMFLHPVYPKDLSAKDVEIDKKSLKTAIERIKKAIELGESIVVYADYDADGITAGTIMWETLYRLGAHVMPYIPHRALEGYGFSIKGIDAVNKKYHPSLIISVDHGIGAYEKISYAKSLGIEVIVTDHHTKGEKLPDCIIVHTTKLCGAGVSWFLSREILAAIPKTDKKISADELLALSCIGTIADMVPLVGPNRSIAYYGLKVLNSTKRLGLSALIKSAAIKSDVITASDISHKIAPRLNAMGRLVHALDALRLLCTTNQDKANELAQLLSKTNTDRQEMTEKNTLHAIESIRISLKDATLGKLIFVSHQEYNQGVIGLVAGKIVEEFYRPTIVVSKGLKVSKASARSISGFNIIEAIRTCSDILVDAGGHPMAAGFTVQTNHLELLKNRLLKVAESILTEDLLLKKLVIDAEIPFSFISHSLWEKLSTLAPFGMGNFEPVFATKDVKIIDVRQIGRDNKHLKLMLLDNETMFEAVGFGLGDLYSQLTPENSVDVAYSIDLNEWNGNRKLQLKIRDIHLKKE